MKSHLILSLFLVVSTLGVSGCGSPQLSDLVPCSGTVVLGGNPVAEANIVFAPKRDGEGGKRSAYGRTDAQGRFEMTTLNPNDGVYPGEYKVIIDKLEPVGPVPTPVTDGEGNDVTPPQPKKNALPSLYETYDKTPLIVTIPPAGNKNLDLILEK